MDLFDSHCHLDVEAFDPDRERVIARARAVGVRGFLVPGVHAEGWLRLLALCDRGGDLFPALGLHPVYLACHRDTDVAELERLLATRRPAAIGEIGLDWYLRELDRERQQHLFEAQLAVAAAARLPVVLHVRKAHDQVLATLRRIRVAGGIAHAFSGSIQQGRQYLDLGFRLGFGGMLTFERSRRLHALARELPQEALVLETDAPDLTVASHQGRRNSPEYLPECLMALARVRDEDAAEVAAYTTHNAREALQIA
jgi:TatD DNase family protein